LNPCIVKMPFCSISQASAGNGSFRIFAWNSSRDLSWRRVPLMRYFIRHNLFLLLFGSRQPWFKPPDFIRFLPKSPVDRKLNGRCRPSETEDAPVREACQRSRAAVSEPISDVRCVGKRRVGCWNGSR
jgi:hypothetical protein